jgi:hypothetical protein
VRGWKCAPAPCLSVLLLTLCLAPTRGRSVVVAQLGLLHLLCRQLDDIAIAPAGAGPMQALRGHDDGDGGCGGDAVEELLASDERKRLRVRVAIVLQVPVLVSWCLVEPWEKVRAPPVSFHVAVSSLLAPPDWLDNFNVRHLRREHVAVSFAPVACSPAPINTWALVCEPHAALRRAAPKMRLGHGHKAVGWC